MRYAWAQLDTKKESFTVRTKLRARTPMTVIAAFQNIPSSKINLGHPTR
jgi:hypothetical protein